MPFVPIVEIEARPNASEFEKLTIEMLNNLKTNPLVLAGAQGLGASIGQRVIEAIFIVAVERLVNKLLDAYDQWLEEVNRRNQDVDPPFERVEVLSREDQAILAMKEKHYNSQKEAIMGVIKELGVLDTTNESVWKSVRFVGEANEVAAEQADRASEGYKNASESLSNYNVNNEDTVQQVKEADKTLGNLEGTMGNVADGTSTLNNNVVELADKNKEWADSQGQVNDVIADTKPAVDQATEGVEGYQDAIEKVDNSGGFFQGIKDGFKQFAESVGSNSELIANFFANTLSQMSKNFSDLFFNVIKGNFDDLADLAKQTFDAILKSFLDLVAAIATKQIVLSIGGLFGLGGGKSSAGGKAINAAGQAGTAINASSVVTGGSGLFSGATGLGGTLGLGSSGLFGASGSFTALGNLVGLGGGIGPSGFGTTLLGAIPAIGAVLAAGAIATLFIVSALKKTPRLDLDFDQFRDEFGKSTGEAVKVMDFLDEDLFNNDIFNRSVSRQAGLGLREELPNVIREAIEGQIRAIQEIIFQLPDELSAQLNEALLNTPIDIESKVKGDRLLEFDETKNIAEKFKQFIEGDLQARFIFSIREFFVGAFDSLGAIPEAARAFVDEQFEEFQNLKGREARAEFGQEFLGSFQTFVDAFNVLNGNAVDSIGATINGLKSLSSTLGFDAIPSIDELDRGLEELVSAAELDPELIQDFLDLRAAIFEVQRAILSSISSIIGNISQLNSTITSLGGSSVDLTGFIDQGLDATLGLLGQDGLSLDDQEALLGEALGFANQLLAEEQAQFAQAQQAAQKAAEARAESQRRAIQAQIDGLEKEKELIEKNFDARLEALQEELRIAEEFARLNESILNTLNSIIFSPESVFTSIEQIGLVQSEITKLQGELAGATDPARQVEIAGQLEESFDRLFGLAGEAFGVNSPEFVAIFDQVTGGLGDLAELTEQGSRSVEEINAEIEALNLERNAILEGIDARIDQAQERLASIQTQNVEATFQASDRVREVFEFLRDEYIRIFEERMAQLDEVTAEGFETEISALNALVAVEDESLVVLRSIEGILSGAKSFMKGSGGVVDFGSGTLAFLHGREAVVPEGQITPIAALNGASGDMNVNVNVNVNGGSEGAVKTVSNEIENMLVRSIRQGGRLRSAIQEAGARRIN